MFDFARFSDGLIVERVQQADNLGQTQALLGKPLAVAAAALALGLRGLGYRLGRRSGS